jgi:tetratricopeptide (TPR) repeat protein
LFDFGFGFDTVSGMRRDTIQAGIIAGLAALCVAGFLGCGRVPDEQREARDRNLRRAIAAREAQDIDHAIELCEKALKRHPDLALAHRELGLMLDNYRRDYVPALYHYQRYLQLRPDAQDRQDVEEMIRHCRIAFAAQIAESPEEMKRDLQAREARIQKLEMEVATLREQTGGGVAPEAAAASRPASAGAAPAQAGAQTQIHVVQAGENLATISTRYYGTPSKWKTIFNANQGKLTDANNLRVGTRLDIPKE